MHEATAVLLATCAVVAPAQADRYSVHGTASLDAAATDNVLSGAASRDSDLFFTVRPGLLMTYALPRMVHELNAELELTRYVANGGQPSLAFRGGWRAMFIPGPLSELVVQATASSSVLSAISAAAVPSETTVQLQPSGQVTALEGAVTEFGSYTPTREIRLSQTLSARGSKTEDDAAMPTIGTAGEASAGVGVDRMFRKDTLALEAGASLVSLERKAPPSAPMGSSYNREIDPRARLLWKHDLSRTMSSAIDGGIAVTVPLEAGAARGIGTFPIFGAQLAYAEVWGVATLAVRRDIAPNLFVAKNTINEIATLGAALPLYWLEGTRRRQPRLAGVGSFGVSRTRLIEATTSEIQSSFIVGRVDAGLQYTPRPGMTYTARYELFYQTGDRQPVAGVAVPGFYRNTIYLSAAIRFPADVAVRVPRRRAGAVRSDRKDLTPLDAEPVIPDLVESGSERGED